MRKALGMKMKLIMYNECRVLNRSRRQELQSYIGELAKFMVPDIPTWPKVDKIFKQKIWLYVKDKFKVSAQCKAHVLKFAGVKWRQFKKLLTTKYVLPFVGQKKKLARPPKKYAFVGREWQRFVAGRISENWQDLLPEKKRTDEECADALTTTLDTPECSGGVEGVGGFISPTVSELLARDRQRSEEFEKIKNDVMSEIARLKAMINDGANLQSPMLSEPSVQLDNDQATEAIKLKSVSASVQLDNDQTAETIKLKSVSANELLLDDDACSFVQPPPPTTEVLKGSRSYEPVVEDKDNKVKTKVVQKKTTEWDWFGTLFNQIEPHNNVPKRFRLLYKYATIFMEIPGASTQIPCNVEVFGVEKTIFVLHENLLALLEYEMIGQSIISAYMLHLHNMLRKNEELERYAFIDPAATFKLSDDFESHVANRLREGNVDRIFFLPHNHNTHWILSIIWDGKIYILNPLPRSLHFPELEKALIGAVKAFNVQTGRSNKIPVVKNLMGSPKQSSGDECGYVVMRYMKDIIDDKQLTFAMKWMTKTRKSYTKEQLDEVRVEALDYIQQHF